VMVYGCNASVHTVEQHIGKIIFKNLGLNID